MSKLAQKIAAATPEPRETLAAWILKLDAEDTAAVEAMAVNPAWSNARIIEFLREEGVAVGKDAVSAWRARCGFRRQ